MTSPRALALTGTLLLACSGTVEVPRGPPPPPEPLGAPIEAARDCAIDGVVRDAAEIPIEGAIVAAVADDSGTDAESALETTDARGTFCVKTLKDGRYALTVTARGQTAAFVAPRPLPLRFQILHVGGAGFTVQGRVADTSGRALAGQLIRASRVSDDSGDIFVVKTDAEGKYEARLPPAPYSLSVRTDSHVGASDVTVDADHRLDLVVERLNPVDRPPPDAVVSWVKEGAVRLATVEAGHGFDDMSGVEAMVGDARVVALGEATHGSREFFQLKHRMLELLVERKGFRVFAIEASYPECEQVNAYVRDGKGDPAVAVAGMRFWTWNTEEVLAMVRWMRTYNEDPKHREKLSFVGFDMQSPPGSVREALRYLATVDPTQVTSFRRRLAALSDDFVVGHYSDLPKAMRDDARAAAAELVARFDAQRAAWEKRTGAHAFALARIHAAVLGQAERMMSDPNGGDAERDAAMAANALALLDAEGPAAKMVIWAHNLHLMKAALTARLFPANHGLPMGAHLARALKSQLVVFGFAFDRGGFQAKSADPATSELLKFDVPAAPPGMLEATLAKVGAPVLALDLRRPAGGAVAEWLGRATATRSIGAVFTPARADAFVARHVLARAFDAVLYVDKTTPARPNPGGERPAPPRLTPVASLINGGFEEVDEQGAPRAWIFRQDSRSGFALTTTRENVKVGSRAARLERKTAPWPWGVALMTQRIDAKSLRNKRIRIVVSARVSDRAREGRGYLFATSRGGNATKTVATVDAPVVTDAWQERAVVIDVGDQAEDLDVGFAFVGGGRADVDDVRIEVASAPKP